MRGFSLILSVALILGGCVNAPSPAPHSDSEQRRLPTGAQLDPAGRITDVGSLPMAMIPSPDGSSLIILLQGYRENGIQVINRATGEITESFQLPAAFIGLAFNSFGNRLYASGGNDDIVYVFDWAKGVATLIERIPVAIKKNPEADAKKYPSGLAFSPDGSMLYVAENLGDSLAVIDLGTKQVVQRVATGRYPYGVAVGKDGTVYVSNWNESNLSVFKPSGNRLATDGTINVGRHPSAMLFNKDASRLFVASASMDEISVIDPKTRTTVARISDAVPGNVREGSTPNALALSPDETRLYIAEADNNAIAIVDLSNNSIIGRIPTAWYPSGIIATGDSLFVLNAKGGRTWPNPGGRGRGHGPRYTKRQSTLGQLMGSIMAMKLPDSPTELAALTDRVSRAN